MRWFHARIKEVAGVYEVCALTEEKACSLPYIGMAQSKVEQTTRAFDLHLCLCLRSDGSLDMFAQEDVYCSRFGKAGNDREISKRERLR